MYECKRCGKIKGMKSNYKVYCMQLKVPSDPNDPLGRGTWQGYNLKLEGNKYSLYCGSRGHISYEGLKDEHVHLLRHIEVYEILDKKIPLVWKVEL